VRSLVTPTYRYTVYKDEPWGELYDLATDPHESHNRWDDPAYAPHRGRLSEELAQELMRAVDQSPRAKFSA